MTMALAATAGERLPHQAGAEHGHERTGSDGHPPDQGLWQEQLPRHEHEHAEQQHTGGVGEGDGQAQGAAWRTVPPEPTR